MRRNPVVGALVGAVGGLLGSLAMVRLNHLIGGSEDERGPHQHHRRAATPNDTDGTIADEPASMQVANLASEAATGRSLSPNERKRGGSIVHYAFGAATGAFYGAAATLDPRSTRGFGLPFGVAVWLTADEAALPVFGLSRKPADIPLTRHAAALATHLVFGLTVEAVRRGVLGKDGMEDRELETGKSGRTRMV